MIGGVVAFVDRLDTTGFSGLGGSQNVVLTAGGGRLAASVRVEP